MLHSQHWEVQTLSYGWTWLSYIADSNETIRLHGSLPQLDKLRERIADSVQWLPSNSHCYCYWRRNNSRQTSHHQDYQITTKWQNWNFLYQQFFGTIINSPKLNESTIWSSNIVTMRAYHMHNLRCAKYNKMKFLPKHILISEKKIATKLPWSGSSKAVKFPSQ